MSNNGVSGLSINLDLTKPATVLIEKIAGAVGVLYEPKRIRSKAQAESDAKLILLDADMKAEIIKQRAIARLIVEESKKQENIESIIAKTLPELKENADPAMIEDDWLSNFFEKAKITSNNDMQDVWSRILSGEANSPGSFSRRTVNLLAQLDQQDAISLTNLASFVWIVDGDPHPLVFDIEDKIYLDHGVNFAEVNHLTTLGLITFEPLSGYRTYRPGTGGTFVGVYSGQLYTLKVPEAVHTSISLGKLLFTNSGKELLKICSPSNVEGFREYSISQFLKAGVIVDTP